MTQGHSFQSTIPPSHPSCSGEGNSVICGMTCLSSNLQQLPSKISDCSLPLAIHLLWHAGTGERGQCRKQCAGMQYTACNRINILYLSISLHVPICLSKEGLLVPLKGTKLNCNLVLGFSLAFLQLKPALLLTQTNTINLTHFKGHIFGFINHHICPFFRGTTGLF